MRRFLSDIDCAALASITDVLTDVARRRAKPQLDFFSPGENFQIVSAKLMLEAIAFNSDSEVTRLLVEEAEHVLVQLQRDTGPPGGPAENFFRLVAWRIADNQLFARIRDLLMSEHGRTAGEQRRWEQPIEDGIKAQGLALLRNAAEHGQRPRQSPPRLSTPIEITLDTLNQPLTDLVGRS